MLILISHLSPAIYFSKLLREEEVYVYMGLQWRTWSESLSQEKVDE
jgi:hypothetical protein